MANVPLIRLTDLQEAVRDVISAREAVRQGIADHAEKRRVAMQELRHEVERQAKISDGIKRQNAKIQSNPG